VATAWTTLISEAGFPCSSRRSDRHWILSGLRGLFPRRKSDRSCKLTIHVPLIRSLRINRALSPFSLFSWHGVEAWMYLCCYIYVHVVSWISLKVFSNVTLLLSLPLLTMSIIIITTLISIILHKIIKEIRIWFLSYFIQLNNYLMYVTTFYFRLDEPFWQSRVW
jgi:hypothetical protein